MGNLKRKIRDCIKGHNGITVYEMSCIFDVPYNAVVSILIAIENSGTLLYDIEGRIYEYEKLYEDEC